MSNVGPPSLACVHMTEAHLVQSRLRVIVGVLWSLGLCLNFVLAISPVWGWSSFLGWASMLVLVVFAFDERKTISLALQNLRGPLDRILATFFLSLVAVAVVVNVVLLVFGQEV